MIRARKMRRRLLWSQRQVFDAHLRPGIGTNVIAYPDAIYEITVDDVIRAMIAAKTVRK